MMSLLLVRAESADDLAEALEARPDVIVFEIEPLERAERAETRRRVAAALRDASARAARPRLVARIAPLASGLVDDDLADLVAAGVEAVLAPRMVGQRDLGRLGAKLAVAEARCGRAAGTVGIIAGAGDTAAGVLALPSLAEGAPRLVALGYDGAAFGDPGSAPAIAARGALVLAALAAGVPALDLGATSPGDLATACLEARRDGFAGRLVRGRHEIAALAGVAQADFSGQGQRSETGQEAQSGFRATQV